MRIYVRLLLGLVLAEFLSVALVIRVSETGNDSSSCWESNGTMPCRTLGHALGALRNAKSCNETMFTVLIEDQVYYLAERVNITQTSPTKSVFLKSSDRSVITCKHPFAGIDIGTRQTEVNDTNANRTRNVFFQNLEFENCGPNLAAVVLIWNSVDIHFMNCVFRHNKQAGINAFDSGVTIENCHFLNNTSNCLSSNENYTAGVTAAGGGAGFLLFAAKNLSLIIKHSIFELNAAVVKDSRRHFVAPSFDVSRLLWVVVEVFLWSSEERRTVVGLRYKTQHFQGTMQPMGVAFTTNSHTKP